MTKRVKKAVIPAAGIGTRLLPLTKNSPKEMLPVLNKPAIQYIVEEAVNSGIEEMLIIIGRGKSIIIDYFDKSPNLESILESTDEDLLTEIERISNLANIHYIRQKEPKGLGDAILYSKTFVNDEPFAVLLGDDIIITDGAPCTKKMIEIYDRTKSPVIAVERVPKEKVSSYGIVAVEKYCKWNNYVYPITHLVEKPNPDDAPSNLGIIGRYILTPDIFNYLQYLKPGYNNEIQLTDALSQMCRAGKYIQAYEVSNIIRYDIGSIHDWLEANIKMSLQHPDYKDIIEKIHRTV